MTEEETQYARYGKYELAELIGEGGMARVFRALQTGPMGFRKEVALKQIRPHISSMEKMVKALINEARLGGNLRHPNVVEVYDFGEVQGSMFITMEYIRGHTLHAVLRRTSVLGLLPPRIVVQIAEQMCKGLAYAHAAKDVDGRKMNLVHRDLKPANVIIDHNAVVKIMDFGIARADTNLFNTTTGMTKGTPFYMSPEQVRTRKDRPIDGRSDLFSLATVICEMVTGQTVFEGTELYEILHKIANAETEEAVQQVGQRIPQLVPLLERAFQEQPEDRYPDAEEMRKDLVACLRELDGDEDLGPWLDAWMALDPQEEAATIVDMPSGGQSPNLAEAIDYEQASTVPSAQIDVPPTAATPLEPPVKVQRTMPMTADPPPVPSPAAPETVQAQPAQRPPRWPLFMVTGAIIALGVAAGVVVIGVMLGPRLLGTEDEGDSVMVVDPITTAADATNEDDGQAGANDPSAGAASDRPATTQTAPSTQPVPTEQATPAPVSDEAPTPEQVTESPPDEETPTDTDDAALLETPEATDSETRIPVIMQAKAPDVLGALSALDVGGPIALKEAEFEDCYRSGLLTDPELAGSLKINIVIEPGGSVDQAQVSGGTMKDAGVQACFRRVLNGLTFAAPSNKQVAIVEYTFVLKSEDPS